jgi:hypothetical protein
VPDTTTNDGPSSSSWDADVDAEEEEEEEDDDDDVATAATTAADAAPVADHTVRERENRRLNIGDDRMLWKATWPFAFFFRDFNHALKIKK